MNVFRFFALPVVIIGLAMLFSGCGGGDDDYSRVSSASLEQSAKAGALVIPAGQTAASVSIVSASHQVGNKLTRVSIAAKITAARSSAGATAGGTRWVLREGGNIIAQGPLSGAPASGVTTSATYEVAVTGGATVTIEITGHVNGPAGTVLQWDEASLSMTTSPI
jgi:hypothetical protein